MRALVGVLVLSLAAVAGCGNPNAGKCTGDTCGKGQCTMVAQCTDSCEKVKVTPGDKCPEGFGCLGFVACVNKDFGNPFDLYGADFQIVDMKGADQSMPVDQSVNTD